MEELLVYFQDPRIMAPVLGICFAALIFAIVKKALKFAMAVIIFGAIVATVKPVTNQLMIDNGISVQGTVLSVNVNDEQYNIDLAMGATLDTDQQADGSYTVTFTLPDQEPTVFSVSKKTAAWLEFGKALILELEKVSEDAVTNAIKTIGMRY